MNETVKGALDRAMVSIVSSLLTWATMRGFLPSELAKELVLVLPILVGAGLGAIIAWIVNRPKALAIAAEKSGAVVLTTSEIADDTPDNKNILSLNASSAEINAAVKGVVRRDAAK